MQATRASPSASNPGIIADITRTLFLVEKMRKHRGRHIKALVGRIIAQKAEVFAVCEARLQKEDWFGLFLAIIPGKLEEFAKEDPTFLPLSGRYRREMMPYLLWMDAIRTLRHFSPTSLAKHVTDSSGCAKWSSGSPLCTLRDLIETIMVRMGELLPWDVHHREMLFFTERLPKVLLELAGILPMFSTYPKLYFDEVLAHTQGTCLCCDLVLGHEGPLDPTGVFLCKAPCYRTSDGRVEFTLLIARTAKEEVEKRLGPASFCKTFWEADIFGWVTEVLVYEACEASGRTISPTLLESGHISFSLVKDGVPIVTQSVYYLAIDNFGRDLEAVFGEWNRDLIGVCESLQSKVLCPFLHTPPETRERVWELYLELVGAGFVQTDMHPGNVVTKDGELRLIDFEYCVKVTPESLSKGPHDW